MFLKAVYVYDDKMLIILKYKDGEICVTFDEITQAVNKKGNSDNRSDYQSSPLIVRGEPKDGVFEHLLLVRRQSP